MVSQISLIKSELKNCHNLFKIQPNLTMLFGAMCSYSLRIGMLGTITKSSFGIRIKLLRIRVGTGCMDLTEFNAMKARQRENKPRQCAGYLG